MTPNRPGRPLLPLPTPMLPLPHRQRDTGCPSWGNGRYELAGQQAMVLADCPEVQVLLQGKDNTATLAAVTRRAILWGRGYQTKGSVYPTALEMNEFLEQHPEAPGVGRGGVQARLQGHAALVELRTLPLAVQRPRH